MTVYWAKLVGGCVLLSTAQYRPMTVRADPPDTNLVPAAAALTTQRDMTPPEASDADSSWVRARAHDISASIVDEAKRPPPSVQSGRWAVEFLQRKQPSVFANIGRDGIVRFRDRSALTLSGIASWWERQPNDRIANAQGPQSEADRRRYDPARDGPLISALVRFDLYDLIVGDAYAAERAKLLSESSPLRAWLAFRDRYCQTTNARGLNEFLAALAHETPAVQKLRLFEAYDACADTALGQAARELIVQQARLSFPPDSPHAYTEDEFVALDRARFGVYAFDPYARQQGRR
jgi:uncharacterized protein YecT (DUF1311 family)